MVDSERKEERRENIRHDSLENAISEGYDELAARGEVDEDIEDTDTDIGIEMDDDDEPEVAADGEEPEELVADDEPEDGEELAAEAEQPEEPDWNEPAPERWPNDMKEVYNSLPVSARRAFLEQIYQPMQRQYTQTTQELSQMRRNIEPMLEVMNQYRNKFERYGVDPAEAFRRQMAWSAHIAEVGPEQGLRDMMASYGLGDQPDSQQTPDEYLTPVERSMKERLERMEQHLQQQSQQAQQYTEQQQKQAIQSRYREVQQGLGSFINETKDGQPAHPHIEKVAPAMAGIIRGGLVQQADEYGRPVPIRDQVAQAYQMACDMDPSIRRVATNGRQVRKAQAANRGVVSKAPATSVDVPMGSLADEISKTYDQLAGR